MLAQGVASTAHQFLLRGGPASFEIRLPAIQPECRDFVCPMATSQAIIENPVINSPFAEPQRHFRFSNEGMLLLPFRATKGVGPGRGASDNLLNLISYARKTGTSCMCCFGRETS